MKTVKNLNDKKLPAVHIDKSLNQYDDKVLFPDKVAKANEMLEKIGLPNSKQKK